MSERGHDVVIVGGGVAGCSIAYRAASAGHRVVLLERRGIAAGASGRNAGVLGAGSALLSEADRAVYALTSANLALVKTLPDELGVDFELRETGTINIATTPEMATHLRESAGRQRAAGLDVEWLDARQAREAVPALTDAQLGAELTRGSGHLWPFALVNGFAAAAKRHGATIRTGVNVERLLRDGDRVTGVVADGERIEANRVVLATNAYTPGLLPELPAGAIVPARGQIVVTQPVPPILPMPFGTNFDKEYGRQTAGDQILCGGCRRFDADEGLGHYAEDVSPRVLAGIGACLTGLFPRLAGVKIVRAWAGIMGFTADGLPLIGAAPWAPGLLLAAGFNGGGFSWTSIVGKVIGALLDGRDPGFDLRPFDPGRFAASGAAWNNPFTAGERSSTTGLGTRADSGGT